MHNYKKYANEILNDVETYKLVLNGGIKRFPPYFWEKPYSLQSSALIVRYLVEDRLKIDINKLTSIADRRFFKDNKLGGMNQILFKYNSALAIQNAYPNRFKPWEFNSVPQGYWTKETMAEAVRWVVEEKMEIKQEKDIPSKFGSIKLSKYGLGRLERYGVYELLDLAYPNKFRRKIENGGLTTANVKVIVKHLIEEKYKWSREQVVTNYTFEFLKREGYSSIGNRFGVYNSINIAYPNEYKPWEFNNVGRNYWTEDNISKALKWLIDEKLKLKSREEILYKVDKKTLNKYGLSRISKYGIYNALNLVYPGEFSQSEIIGIKNKKRDNKKI